MEIEIQALLILHGSGWLAVKALLQKYEAQKCSLGELELISTFCLHAGYGAELLKFLCKQIKLDAEIPWGHFAEALGLCQPDLSIQIGVAAIQGAREQNLLGHLARSYSWDQFDPGLQTERDLRKRAHQEQVLQSKSELLHQVEMFKSQDLDDEEERVLKKLNLMFPRDPQIQEKLKEQKGRRALRFLDSRTSQAPQRDWRDVQAELEPETLRDLRIINTSMQSLWAESGLDPQLGLDFAVAQMMWDYPEGSLQFLGEKLLTPPALWLRCECQLRTRRFLDLLTELVLIETRWANDPEAAFAVSYLRAQALWGLGRRFEAIDLLEGLVTVRPSYRSASGLLAMWKGQES